MVKAPPVYIHYIKIFLNKNKFIIIYEKDINDKIFKKLKLYENIIMDNLNHKIDEKLLYSIFNINLMVKINIWLLTRLIQ